MKYIGNTMTGEVFCASNTKNFISPQANLAQLYIDGVLVELTNNQKGEFKFLIRKRNLETFKFEFKAITRRNWRKVKEYIENGWELRKDCDKKTTYDEYSSYGIILNKNLKAI